MRQIQRFLKLGFRPAAFAGLLAFGLAPSAFAQLDFGTCPIVDGKIVQEEYCQPGIADFLSNSEKEIFKKVRSSMQRWQWNNSRRGLVDLITRVRTHPDTSCRDQFGGASFALQCTYTEGGQTRTQVFPWLMSSDVNSHFDKNVTTIEEEHQAQVAAYNSRTFNSGQSGQTAPNGSRSPASNASSTVRPMGSTATYNSHVAQTSQSKVPQQRGGIFLLSSKAKTAGSSAEGQGSSADPALVDATGGKD